MQLNNSMKILHGELKRKQEQIEREKARGAAIRARIEWHFEGEQWAKFFFDLEKQKLSKHFITEIIVTRNR